MTLSAGAHPATVVVCTRDRPGSLPTTIESILANDGDFRLIVVDQSSDGQSADYLATLDDERLRVVPTSTVGLSRARNIGLAASDSDLILMTDDDCVVSTTWVADMTTQLRSDDRIAAVFGVVEAADYDQTQGYVPDGPIPQDRTFCRVRRYDPCHGIGACVGFRRSAVLQVGGFDPMLGAGAPLKSAEEIDVVLRLLIAGHHVRHSTTPVVVHHGFRTFEETKSLVRGYMLGTGAAHGQLLRLGHPSVLLPLARAICGSSIPPAVSALRAFRVPPILGRITSTCRGIWIGVRMTRVIASVSDG
ncbi:MAG: glycosyltransferase family A protein [Ilumatobacteraceae bacterium]|nr:glycosyltransferase family A protein [Ilumatobacteraceae bacterium]